MRARHSGFVAAALAVLAAGPALAWEPPQPMTRNGRFVMQDGAAIYRNVCTTCHMADAKGATGAGTYPALAGDKRLADPAYPIYVVLKGQKGMPDFGPLFDDAQVAAVVGYVRTNFGNSYKGPVTAEAVKALR